MHDEHLLGVDCFGARCTIALTGSGSAPLRALAAARFLLECHRRLSRFLPDSELSRLNVDRRETVPVSPLMLGFVEAALRAARSTGGLVDPTILPSLRRAGYAESRPARDTGGPRADLVGMGGERRAAAPDPAARWREIGVDPIAGTVTRPVGTEIDSGGIAKGWAADAATALLGPSPTCAVECAGDLRAGGSAGVGRRIAVADPFGAGSIATLTLSDGGVATSGIGRRFWHNDDGSVGHHLIDPATGDPCLTGVVQATALAPSAEEAEWRAKAAVLAGPDGAAEWLADGGIVVLEDASVERIGACGADLGATSGQAA